MAEFVHMKNRTVDLSLLHFYGCSYPAGHEITDPKEKGKSYTGKILEAAIKKNKSLSFPSSIAKHFEVDFTNHAIYGCSNEHSASLLAQDALRGKIKRDHGIFFCTTQFSRIMEFDPVDGKPYSSLLTDPSGFIDCDNPLDILNHYNDYKTLYNYFMTLYKVVLIAKSVGAPLFFLPMFDSLTFNNLRDYVDPYDPEIAKVPEKIQEWDMIPTITSMVREIQTFDVLPKIKSMDSYVSVFLARQRPKKVVRNPGFHPTLYAHNCYADEVIKALEPKKDK